MRRRDFLAGVGSVGVVAGAGAVAVYGVPSPESLRDGGGEDGPYEPLEIETIDAPGSEAGTIQVPDPEQATFVDFFATWCGPCIDQMPALAEANERIGDEVLFYSVTNENFGDNGASPRLISPTGGRNTTATGPSGWIRQQSCRRAISMAFRRPSHRCLGPRSVVRLRRQNRGRTGQRDRTGTRGRRR